MSRRTIVYAPSLEGPHQDAVVLSKTDPVAGAEQLGSLLRSCRSHYPNAKLSADAHGARILRDIALAETRQAVRLLRDGAALDGPDINTLLVMAGARFESSQNTLGALALHFKEPGQQMNYRHLSGESGVSVVGAGRRLVARGVYEEPETAYGTYNEAQGRFIEAMAKLAHGDNAYYTALGYMHYARLRAIMGLAIGPAVGEALLYTVLRPWSRMAALGTIGRLGSTLTSQRRAIDSVKSGGI